MGKSLFINKFFQLFNLCFVKNFLEPTMKVFSFAGEFTKNTKAVFH